MTLNTNIRPEDMERSKHKDLQGLIDDFAKANVPYAEVLFTNREYKSLETAQACMCRAVKQSGRPYKVRRVNGHLYLINTTLT